MDIPKRKFESVEDYISAYPPLQQQKLEEIRAIICQAAPDATEVISYNMPAIKQHSVVVYYAAYKEHIGFYPTARPMEVFREELTAYKTSKGAIQFPIGQPIPAELVRRIVQFRLKEVEALAASKKAR